MWSRKKELDQESVQEVRYSSDPMTFAVCQSEFWLLHPAVAFAQQAGILGLSLLLPQYVEE